MTIKKSIKIDSPARCWWCGDDPLYIAYHDEEWGAPVADDRRLFEKLCLEGFQAGLSWITILRKREAFRSAFDQFDPKKIAKYDEAKITALLQNAGIIRHRGKIEAVINNARLFPQIVDEFGSFSAYIWSFEPDEGQRPKKYDRESLINITQIPASLALSKDLKKRGWKFVGATTCYAFMQSMGLVNDHVDGCFMRKKTEEKRISFHRPKGISSTD